MFSSLLKRWKVSKKELVLILCVFAITGFTTAYISRAITSWVGFTHNTHWLLKLSLRLAVLIFGYQVILLTVAFLLGQFSFFWRFEKKLLQRFKLMKDDKESEEKTKEIVPMENNSSIVNRETVRLKLAIFASGTGTNAQKLIDYFRNSAVATVALIVCNKPGAGVLRIAEKENIPTLMIEKETFFRGDGYLPFLKEKGIGFVVLAGFLWKIPATLIAAYPRRIVNIHPALLPKFGGKGMYGQYVHEAVLQAGEVETGITIHYVDEKYDNGDIIFQTACPILAGDTPEAIANRIHHLEHLHYPRVVEETIRTEDQMNK